MGKYAYSPGILFTTKYALHLLLVEHSKGLKSKDLQVVEAGQYLSSSEKKMKYI